MTRISFKYAICTNVSILASLTSIIFSFTSMFTLLCITPMITKKISDCDYTTFDPLFSKSITTTWCINIYFIQSEITFNSKYLVHIHL